MVKLESLKKASSSKKTLKEKKHIQNIFQYLQQKVFISQNKNNLLISFVMKKKIKRYR